MDESTMPVKVDGIFEKVLRKKANKVLALQRRGINLIFPDVLKIEEDLLGTIGGEENI